MTMEPDTEQVTKRKGEKAGFAEDLVHHRRKDRVSASACRAGEEVEIEVGTLGSRQVGGSGGGRVDFPGDCLARDRVSVSACEEGKMEVGIVGAEHVETPGDLVHRREECWSNALYGTSFRGSPKVDLINKPAPSRQDGLRE